MTTHGQSAAAKAAEAFALRLILDHLKMAGGVAWIDVADETDDDVSDLQLVLHELALTAAAALIMDAETPNVGRERAIREIEGRLKELRHTG